MAKKPQRIPKYSPQMSGPITGSLLFHALVILVMIVGVPHMRKDMPVIAEAIAVEIMTADQLEQETAPEPPREVRQRPPQNLNPPPRTPPMPQVAAREPPKPVAPSKPEPAELAPPKPEPEPEKPAPPVRKPEPPKPPPAAKAPEPEPKKNTEQQQEDFRSVLKNLMPDEPEASPQKPVETADAGRTTPAAARTMTGHELSALTAQLSQCWKLMSGARYAEDLIVDVRLFVNPDRSVRDAQIVDRMRYNTDSYYRAAADSAIRAVRNPYCNPLDLPAQKYDLWKVMTVSFDPRQML